MDISKSARSTLILLFFIIAVHVMGQSGNQLIRIHTVSNASSLGSITNALEGNVGIGVQDPSEKLQVNGNILATGTIVPDYVFEHYFEGKSKLNPEYTFTDLEETIEFTKKNHHLPGIPSAKKIEKQGGILINRAVEQNLEKIEELYLHLYELHQKKDSLKTVLQQKINQKEKVNVKQRIKPIEAVLEE